MSVYALLDPGTLSGAIGSLEWNHVAPVVTALGFIAHPGDASRGLLAPLKTLDAVPG